MIPFKKFNSWFRFTRNTFTIGCWKKWCEESVSHDYLHCYMDGVLSKLYALFKPIQWLFTQKCIFHFISLLPSRWVSHSWSNCSFFCLKAIMCRSDPPPLLTDQLLSLNKAILFFFLKSFDVPHCYDGRFRSF